MIEIISDNSEAPTQHTTYAIMQLLFILYSYVIFSVLFSTKIYFQVSFNLFFALSSFDILSCFTENLISYTDIFLVLCLHFLVNYFVIYFLNHDFNNISFNFYLNFYSF